MTRIILVSLLVAFSQTHSNPDEWMSRDVARTTVHSQAPDYLELCIESSETVAPTATPSVSPSGALTASVRPKPVSVTCFTVGDVRQGKVKRK